MFLIDDFIAAWRGLRHAPAFLALSSAVLALGLGATIFTYGVINTTLLKPPPFPGADRLYTIQATEPARKQSHLALAYLDYAELKEQQHTFADLAAQFNGTVILSGEGMPERYSGGMVTWNFMRVLGGKPLIGRDFNESDDLPTSEPTVILSYNLWRTRFNQDPDVLGRVVRVNARPSVVIGVMPQGFSYPTNEALWVPMARDVAQEHRGEQSYESAVGVGAIGRLAAGVTARQAEDEMAEIMARLATLYPRSNGGMTTAVEPIAVSLIGDGARIIYAMFAAVWLVLLIACANVASLIFVRANFRVYEAGMRVALGARRPRLVVQMLAESVIVSLIGVAGGLVIAAIALHLMAVAMKSLVEVDTPTWWTFSIDLRVAALSGLTALIAALLSGIVPALRASRPDVMRILRDGGRTGTGMRLSKFTAAMVIVELALSASLLTGAGLMTRATVLSFQKDYGADVKGFMSARVGLPLATYSKEAQSRFFEQLVEQLRTKPGVLAATASTSMPGTGADEFRFAIEGKSYESRTDYPVSQSVTVTPGTFATFRRPILQGRDFNSSDRTDSAAVTVVNDAFVRKYLPNQNPLGQRLLSIEGSGGKPLTIIGVAANINHDDTWTDNDFPPTLYRPVSQLPGRFMTVAIRTKGEPTAYGKTIRDVVQHLDPDLAPYWVKTLQEFQMQKRAPLRLLSNVFAAFAVIAIILAAVGIYGVLAFATGQRNREIGVRRALGAHDSQILTTVMRNAVFQLLVGLGLGAILAPIMARAMVGGRPGLSPDDPVIYACVFSLLLMASLLASWIPARRALRVQPATALRCD
ncbi:MAG: ABC transporter permease [Gammaproteobacteria bacterium]